MRTFLVTVLNDDFIQENGIAALIIKAETDEDALAIVYNQYNTTHLRALDISGAKIVEIRYEV